MNNTETLVTSDTQETRQNKHYSKQKEQHRDTDNIGYTRQNKHQSKQKEQHRQTDNIRYTRHRTK